MQLVSVQNVKYSYLEQDGDNEVKGAPVVNDVSLDIEEGSFVALLGHNGSGKSTLARLLNALFLPDEGTVTVCGFDTRDEAHTWEIRSNAGMVFQNPDNQLVSTVVEEDVAFGPENMGIEPGEIRARVDAALSAVRMADFAKAAPHMLSGGQKQRITIAGVLAMRPRVMIFDEATAMLDPMGREEVLATVHRLNRENGITVIWITHFMEEAATADRVVVISDGRISLDGAPRQVFTHVDELKQLGLDVPEMTELAIQLRKDGVDVPADTLTVEEMAEAICRLK